MNSKALKATILSIASIAIIALVYFIWPDSSIQRISQDDGYLGSESCRECHERFYQLWAPSHHGLAMQEVTPELLIKDSIMTSDTFHMEGNIYQSIIKKGKLFLVENKNGEINEFESPYVCGGKYIYYFLIPLERGKLQVMPLAYDLRGKEWYNNPQSGARHFEGGEEDEALNWRNQMYTFNSNCLACHVSQTDHGFDLAENSYHTSWKEPGINCEACHGPSQEHSRVFTEARDTDVVPTNSHLIMTSHMDNERDNSACLNCHAQMRPITESFTPGERFYDHYTLNTLEDPDSYSDGRDLGENFTMTTWELSKCNLNKDFTCVDCHTSSGRYRFADRKIANNACLPCHTERVNNPEPHTHHEGGELGIRCVDCHMPTTDFARMDRSDHSNRPPLPSASIEFGSPNACNLCHDDKTAQWSDGHVREWHKHDYQEPYLVKARLVRQAREGNWENVNEMLAFIDNNPDETVYINSLIRLSTTYTGEEKWPVILKATENESPLVRSSAVHELAYRSSIESKAALIRGANDDYRVVRIEAAFAAHRQPEGFFTGIEYAQFDSAMVEYERSMTSRPDIWSSHYNLGNHYSEKQDFNRAIKAYQTSLELNEDQVQSYVNLGMTYAYMQDMENAKAEFEKALNVDSRNEVVITNYALLMVELRDLEKAESLYRDLFEINPQSGLATYNLAIICAERSMQEAVDWARKAHEIMPDNLNYHYTLAFYEYQNKEFSAAIQTLNNVIKAQPSYVDAYLMLAQVYTEQGSKDKAIAILKKAKKIENIEAKAQKQVNYYLQQLGS